MDAESEAEAGPGVSGSELQKGGSVRAVLGTRALEVTPHHSAALFRSPQGIRITCNVFSFFI